MEFDFEPQDDLARVPEAFRGMYAAEPNDEGKYVVAEQLAPVSTAVVGLNKALKAARAEAKAKNIDLSPLNEFGETPEEIKQNIQAKLDELADAKGAKVDIDKIKQDLARGHSKELEKHQTRTQALQNQLYETLVKNEAISAITDAKGIPELLLPYVSNQVKVVEEDGKFQPYVVDNAGDVRYSGVTGQPMTIRELVSELKANEKLGRAFESEAPRGGGMNPNGGRKVPMNDQPKTSVDKISAGLSKKQYR